MKLEIELTMPVPVKSVDNYKERVSQIFTEQIPFIFSIIGTCWWYWLIIWWVIPFWLAYSCMSLVELLFITIFLPIACVPYLRGISTTIQALCFGLEFVIGFIGLIPQTYGDY